MKKTPNPQGKGLVPALERLQHQGLGIRAAPKQIDQISLELFTSLFVLQSELKFSPVAGQEYFMYLTDGIYKLLMISPEEWNGSYRGKFIGSCILQQDRTWTLELAAAVASDEAFIQHIEESRVALNQRLAAAQKVEDVLPVYAEELGFHGRVMAYVLGRSLLSSMQGAGINALTFDEAKGLLSGPVDKVQ